jgi:YD repeat-containing protein
MTTLNRVIKITYPDQTTTQYTYDFRGTSSPKSISWDTQRNTCTTWQDS